MKRHLKRSDDAAERAKLRTALIEKAKKYNIPHTGLPRNSSEQGGDADYGLLHERILNFEAHRSAQRSWWIALTSAIASIFSGAAAWYAVIFFNN